VTAEALQPVITEDLHLVTTEANLQETTGDLRQTTKGDLLLPMTAEAIQLVTVGFPYHPWITEALNNKNGYQIILQCNGEFLAHHP